MSHRACDAQLRRRYPSRARLKSRVRYAASHDLDLTLDERAGGWVCGLARWPIDREPVGAGRLQELGLHNGAPPSLKGEDLQRVSLVRLLQALLLVAGGPLDLDDLVSIVAGLLGVFDAVPPRERLDDGLASWADRLPDQGSSPAEQAEARDYLKHLWREIQTLPVRQRVALLLNLRDERGHGVISLLTLTETAGIPQIASTLEIAAEELTALWPDLPIDDARIAGRLGLTRQQVINLRKAARLRLARRMRSLVKIV